MLKKMLRNNKGEQLLSIVWFVLLAIFALGVIVIVSISNPSDVDVNFIDAELLYNNLLSCVIDKGILEPEVFNSGFNIFDFCNIDNAKFSSEELFFKMEFVDSNGAKLREDIYEGGDFEKSCLIKSVGVKNSNSPKCIIESGNYLYEIDGDVKSFELNIMTGANIQ